MKKESLLVPREKYLSAGVHIGLAAKTADMQRFIYKVRPNGLAVLNVGVLDKRLLYAARVLAGMKHILAVSRKDNGKDAVKKFAEIIGAMSITDRFMPGTLTNPALNAFYEPDVLVVTDPYADKQAIKESVKKRIPIIGLADTFNETSYLDLVLPCNNKGKKSISLIYWILAQQIMALRGEQFTATPEEFGYEEKSEQLL